MGKQKQNVVTTIYNRGHAPYVYGAFNIVRSGSWNTTKPFVVSRRTATGEALVYGSILQMLLKVLLQIEKLREFSIRADAAHSAAQDEDCRAPIRKVPLTEAIRVRR